MVEEGSATLLWAPSYGS